MQSHHYLDDVALSDLAFEASGETLHEMFEASAQALMEAMVNTRGVAPRIPKTISLQSGSVDRLLFDWLSELVYLKDADGLLFSRFNVTLGEEPVGSLTATAWGERINPRKHTLRADVKAVTFHLFEITQKNQRWNARVVLDI